MSIALLIMWTLVTIIHFSNPKEKSVPNWAVGLITLTIVIDYVIEVFSK